MRTCINLLTCIGLLIVGAVSAVAAGPGAVPPFSLEMAGGGSAEMTYEQDHLVYRTDDSSVVSPKAIFIHFFQPDCNSCLDQMEALERLRVAYADAPVLVLGVAHRGDEAGVLNAREQTKAQYDLLLGVGADLSRVYARGDAAILLGANGDVEYSQVGYAPSDDTLWRDQIDALLQGDETTGETAERKRLDSGDRLFSVELPALHNGEWMSLRTDDGLVFRDTSGHIRQPKAAIGMFSRYCTFSLEEMEELQKLHDRYAEQGLLVYAIAMLEDTAAARTMSREKGFTYPIFNGVGSTLGAQYAYG